MTLGASEKHNYLVTGGAGFIGSHLCDALAGSGHRVRVLDNLSSGRLENLAQLDGAVEFHEGDVRQPGDLARAMKGIHGVFHQAALVSVFDSVERPGDNHDINITGTLNVLAAARRAGVKRVVMASSAAVYGNDPALPKREDMRPQPESPYAIGKIAGEYYLRVFSQLYGVEAVALRYFNVYGPRQDPSSMYSGVISRFTAALRAGQVPTVFGDGLQTRDFVNVRDVVAANLLAMQAAQAGQGEALNVGTGKAASLLDLLRILGELSARPQPPQFQPARAGDIRHSVSDISRARALLGFAPKTELAAGLAELWAWLERGNR